MMAKRKRSTLQTPSRKRAKGASRHPHGEHDPEEEFRIKSIVDETKTHYQISWEDNEVTGEKYANTWEPKANANKAAIDDWERQKAEGTPVPAKQSRKGSNSRSVSASLRGSPKKPSTPAPRRGRPRKVIESSSPLAETPNGKPAPPEQQVTDDLLEIDESQHTPPHSQAEPGAAPSGPGSPLFVLADSQTTELPEQPHGDIDQSSQVGVYISQPPSSYLAGGYEAIDSSQIAPSSSAVAALDKSPKHSQYLPDPNDTTGATEGDTINTTGAPTTPSQQVQSVPVNFGSSTKIVPDSQAFFGSSSYDPSATTALSSSAPEDRRSGPIERDDEQSQQLESGTQVSHGEPGKTSAEQTAQASSVRDSESRRPAEGVDTSGSRAEVISQNPIEDEGNFDDQTRQSNRPIVDAKEPTDNPDQEPELQAKERSTEPEITKAFATQAAFGTQPTSAQIPLKAHVSDEVDSSGESNSLRAAAQLVEDIDSSSAQARDSNSAPNGGSGGDPISHQIEDEPSSAPARILNQIDLTAITQDKSTSNSLYTVTPPQQAVNLIRAPAQPPALESSDWLPSAFQTQISQPASAGTVDRSQYIQSQPLPQSLPQATQLSTITPRAHSLTLPEPSPFSPIIEPPSQSIQVGAVGSSAPPQPALSSSPRQAAMEGSQTPKSLAARIQEMRERKRNQRQSSAAPASTPAIELPDGTQQQPSAEKPPVEQPAATTSASAASAEASAIPPKIASPLLAPENGRRSPSAVPAAEPLPVITLEEMNTSGRYGTLLPQSQDSEAIQRKGSPANARTPSESNKNEDPEIESLHTIPISLSGHQRDQYPQTIYYYTGIIQKFLASADPDTALVDEARQVIERARRVAMHPDLDNSETLTQYDVEPSQQVYWDIKCSAKFSFLKELIDNLRGQEKHIVILSSPGRVVDMLETFLQGIRVSYDRPIIADDLHNSADEGGLKVTLLATDVEVIFPVPSDLVVGMDNFARHDTASVRSLRQHGDRWTPMITLVVPKTIEHVERTISPSLPDLARARALVSGVYQLKTEAGKLEEGQLVTKDAAIAIAQYLTTEMGWPLVPLGKLHDLESQTESDIDPTIENGADSAPHGEKRHRESNGKEFDATETNKKARFGPAVNSQDIEITHISDSVDKTTQSNAESSSLALNDIEKRLQGLLLETQNRLDEHVQALSDLQYRHEEQRNKLVETTGERDAAVATAQQAVARYSEQSNSMSTLRARKTELEQQLTEANERLLSHSIPEKAEAEALRLAKERETAEKEKLERRVAQLTKDLDYTRELYQQASTSGARVAAENSELENQLAVAQNKATGEQVRLRQMGLDAFGKNLRDENRRLKAALGEREAAIKSRDEEIVRLKEDGRGRMGTRGSSVPRSRVGSPMKMDGRNSRQGSPATATATGGDSRAKNGLLHPPRNA